MKCCTLGLSLLMAITVLTGCETPYGTPDRTGTGALAGAAIGATSGAILGGRNAGEGALIGGAIGALTGALIGHSMDEDERARLRAEAPITYERVQQAQPLAVSDVKAMVASKISDDVIISQINDTRSVFHLTAAEIIELHNAGASEKVIQFMINTPNTVAATPRPQTYSLQTGPPPVPQEPLSAQPTPGYVWIPGAWQWSGRWIWTPGFWGALPSPSSVWVSGYWSPGPGGYVWVAGRWR